LVDKHSNNYKNHGFCAQNSEKASTAAENFMIPYLKGGGWDSFDPTEYKTYETRERWIRLPVDSKLSIDQYTHPIVFKLLKLPPLELFLEDDRSTIMHPTAEGHAATAQANFEKIKELE
jgi:hypothetical protein